MGTPVTWTRVGEVAICPRRWPLFPDVPARPGLYRIALPDGRAYIGEAGDLRRRLYEYRRPTKGNEGEHLIHFAIRDAGGARLDIAVDPHLADRRLRREAERTEIREALERGLPLLNDDGPEDAARIEAKIAYHEREIARLRARLSELQGP